MFVFFLFFFFFTQNPAYYMRISDWSSDVCSSDLEPVDQVDELLRPGGGAVCPRQQPGLDRAERLRDRRGQHHGLDAVARICAAQLVLEEPHQPARPP